MSRTAGPVKGSAAGEEIVVLHVDPDPNFAEVTESFLERESEEIRVIKAETAPTAYDRFREEDIDCIVSDYDMPTENGIEFLERVREVDDDIPFILFTGKGSEEIASEAISAGVTDYVQKTPNSSQFTVLTNRIVNAVTQYQTERRLETTEKWYRRLIEKSRDVIAVIDADGVVEYVSPSGEQLLGYSKAELTGSTVLDHIHPEDRGEIATALEDLVETGVSRSGIEFRFRLADGTWTWIEARGRNLLDDPVIGGLVITARDVSDRKEREAELARSNDLLRHTEELAETGGWEVDFESNDVRWTVGTRDIHEVDEAFEPTLERAIDFYHPADRDVIEALVFRCRDQGEPFDRELRIQTATGDLRWVRVRGEPVGEDGDVRRVRGAIQDITARTERERELSATRERMEYALEATDSMIWDVDIESDEVVRHGPIEELFGVSPERMPTADDFRAQAIHPEDREMLEAKHEAVKAGDQEVSDTVYRTNPANGEVKWILERPYVVIGPEDAPQRIIGLSTDVTERKHRERSLRRKNERLEEFASIVSHDLRNPLNVASGRLELAQEECDSEHLAAVDRSHQRMQALIQDLLTLAQQGESVSTLEPVELGSLSHECWENVQTADAELTVEAEGVVKADPGRLQQLLENLFRNAAEHGGDAVTITVGTLPSQEGFYVEDDGQGIPASERDRVFEGGYSTDSESTGFGLAIVKRIAEAHDWTVSLAEGPDGGARFEFTEVAQG